MTKKPSKIKGSNDPDQGFQVFVKPVGPVCNLSCAYCYYLEKESLFQDNQKRRMDDNLLEKYISSHIEAAPGDVISFSWHGGEPTLAGLKLFQKIVSIQQKLLPKGKRITNGIQTNGTLLNDAWCRFFAGNGFTVGLSLDGPSELHDKYRLTKNGGPTHEKVMRAYELLTRHGVHTEILCVVNAHNVNHPMRIYRFFKKIGVRYISFLPLVEREPDRSVGVSERTVPAAKFGEFLCRIFDEWKVTGIGVFNFQIIDEAAQTASGREHALCIFRETCGDIPVVEHNGDFFSCDHFVDPEHLVGNVGEKSLKELLRDPVQTAFGNAKRDTLPRYCRECDVLDLCNGGCPKNRFIRTPDGEDGLNYLCEGYRMFFRHCGSFVAFLGALRRQEGTGSNHHVQNSGRAKPGRNDPCPCGSGRKYKKCCLGKD